MNNLQFIEAYKALSPISQMYTNQGPIGVLCLIEELGGEWNVKKFKGREADRYKLIVDGLLTWENSITDLGKELLNSLNEREKKSYIVLL